MKPITINVQITKNPKQYEAVRLGLEASLDAGETVESAIKAATEQLNALYVGMYQQKPKDAQNAEKEPKNGTQQVEDGKPKEKERLTFEDKRLQAIVKRMEREPAKKEEIFKEALKWFEPDENALKTLQLAARII